MCEVANRSISTPHIYPSIHLQHSPLDSACATLSATAGASACWPLLIPSSAAAAFVVGGVSVCVCGGRYRKALRSGEAARTATRLARCARRCASRKSWWVGDCVVWGVWDGGLPQGDGRRGGRPAVWPRARYTYNNIRIRLRIRTSSASISRGKVVRALAASGSRAPSFPPARARSPIAKDRTRQGVWRWNVCALSAVRLA